MARRHAPDAVRFAKKIKKIFAHRRTICLPGMLMLGFGRNEMGSWHRGCSKETEGC